MKSKDKKELHKKSVTELNNLVAEARSELTELKLDKAQNKLKNTSLLSLKKREIAQIATIIRLKELAEVQAEKKE